MKKQRINHNPNIISEVHEPLERLERLFRIFPAENETDRKFYPNNTTFLNNSYDIYVTYNKALDLLIDHPEVIPVLTMGLEPDFSDIPPDLNDQKIGGIPDLRNWLYTKETNNYENLKNIWPRCGCCHEYMKGVGQFDLYPWVIPLTAAFGRTKQSITGPFGGYNSGIPKNLTEHHRIYSETMLHVLMCPYAGQHFYNPNSDAVVLFTYKYENGTRNNQKEENLKQYLDAYHNLDLKADSFCLDEKKINSYKFRLGIDHYRSYNDSADEIIENNPDIFEQRTSLLGVPASQQEPKRPFCQNGFFPVAPRMTPFFNFNDAAADFTYQIYVDMNNDNYISYGKTDGSCT